MSEVHFHLVLNHFPLMGTLFGCILLLYGQLRGNVTVLNIAFSTFIFSGAFSGLAYFSGLWASDIVNSDEAKKTLAGSHELAGELAAYAGIFLGLTAYPVYLLHKEKKASAAGWTMLLILFSFAVLGLMIWAAWSGGKIEH